MIRKIIGLLCAAIVLTSVSVVIDPTIFADAAEKPGEISQGENITKVRTKFDEITGTLTVSGKGDMPKYMTFRGNKEIRKVVVKKGITSVCDWAFFECNNLKSVELQEGLLKIGVDSFGMTNIKDLVIPSSVQVIGQCAFWGCKSLETIKMPGDFKLQYNEDDPDESEFRLVSTYEWSGFAPKKITFTTPLNIDNISALSATDFVVSDDDPLYSSIDGAIYSKDGTALVRIPSERTEFRVPDGVNTVYINSFHYSFYMEDDEFCVRLEKLYLPKGKCTIAKKMTEEEEFNLESNYLQIVAEGTELDGRSLELLEEFAGRLYDEAESSKEWYLIGFGELVTLREDGCLVSNDGIVLKYFGDGGKVKLGKDIKGIAREAFKFSSITGIKMSDSVVYIGEKAFYDTKNLKSVNIPKSVTEWGREGTYSYAFSGSGLKKIVFEDGIEEIPDSICSGCYKLKTVVFPKTLKKIGSDAFRYCISLNIGKFSGFKELPNLTSIGSGAFENCKMKKFVIPEQITEIGFHAFNIDRENAKKAQLVVMGYTDGYDDSFWGGKAVPVFKKGFSQAKCGLSWGSYLSQPDKNGMLWIKLNWNSLKGADGYEIEISLYSDFSRSERQETTETNIRMEIKSDKADPEAIYARGRAYKNTDDKETREYSGWSSIVCGLERN